MRTYYNNIAHWLKPNKNKLNAYLALLDAGHGGIIDGKPVTRGKRSPIWADGYQYFEGVGNRVRREFIAEYLKHYGVRYEYLNIGEQDVPLRVRTEKEHIYAEENGIDKTLTFSIHSNGHSNVQAEGFEVYTSPGKTNADICAGFVFSNMKEAFPKRKMRVDMSDGDTDKEARFWMLTQTKSPAVLTEDFFHTNEYECNEILRSEDHQKEIAISHAKAIIEYFEYLKFKGV